MLKVGRSFYSIVAGIIFLAAALLHGFRAYYGYDLVYDGWVVPIALSWGASLVAFIMALWSFKNLK